MSYNPYDKTVRTKIYINVTKFDILIIQMFAIIKRNRLKIMKEGNV